MKKDDIIAAALVEFSSHDYQGASINTIIEQSGTSKGTFYHHFPSKEALYLELIRRVSEEKVRFMQGLAEENSSTGSTLFDLLRSQIEASVKFSATHPEYAQFSARVAKETSNRVRQKIDELIGGKALELFSQQVHNDIQNKHLRADLSEEFVTHMFLFMVSRFNEFLLDFGVTIEVDNMERIMAVLSEYIDFIEKGLGSDR